MIYLDSAATTLQKPPGVARAVCRAMHTMTSPGRGGHRAAMAAADTAFACREEAAALFGMADPGQVVFTGNATHALNLAIKSLVSPGQTVLISGYEHNAVTRPLHAIEGVRVKVARAPLFQPETMLEQFRLQMTEEVSAVICTHVSNVFGYVLPIEEIAQLCADRGKPLIVDASQSAGCLPVDVGGWNAAFVAMPGHKGLYGPQGTGLLLCAAPTRTLLEGGTGSESLRQSMPDVLPDRLEAGTHNIPGIAGLLEGIRFLRRKGIGPIGTHERRLIEQAVREMRAMPGVRLFARPPEQTCQSNVLSFQVEGLDCEQAAQLLGRQGIAVRAGLHCAPLAHQTAGTQEEGTVRISVSAFNNHREIERFLHTLSALRRRAVSGTSAIG